MTFPETEKTRTLIYGSCVSRDTYEFLDPDQYVLHRYIARQSLISGFSKPTEIAESDLEPLGSEFQRRTLRDDFSSSLPRDIERFAPETDVLLWDLTDERLGVWDLGDGRYVTRSVELITCGLDRRLESEATLVPFGSPQHKALWRRALGDFLDTLRRSGLRNEPLLLATRWATHDEHNKPLTSLGPSPEVANRLLRGYYNRAARISTHLSLSGQEPPPASNSHRWGAAPFHYSEGVYRELAEQITDVSPHQLPHKEKTWLRSRRDRYSA